ncbi:hypothetical protein [Sphaerotilus sp.]|uniref:hypothetical protein n=1 Tax=Sphaerotilus sp. TaxID=2093942 RepID=UPI0034E1C708
MYLLSQLWLYLLLACLAGLALGLLLNRFCQQRRHATELAALQDRLDALDAEHRQTSARALALSASVDEHHAARQELGAEVASLQGRLDALQTAYESRITLLNTETSRAAHLSDQLADLQTRHAALEAAHRTALSTQADVAREADESLLAARSECDAQAAGQSAAQLREQALQQELAQSQSRSQELETELRALRVTLAENDEQLATLSARLQTERDQQQQAQARIAELAALVPPPVPAVPAVVRPAVSDAASLTGAELERLVLAAGAGQQPAPVELDHQRPDDLKSIDGIGPVNERWLHAQGVRYFWQIASWSPAELAWVANHLPNFGSRVYRENWIAQAARLAARPSMG